MSYLSDNQVRTFQLQVFRSGVWVDIPVTAAHGNKQQGQAGTLEVKIADRLDDQYRSILYEGDKVRAICGIMGSQSVRRFTGFVDAPTGTDQAGINRDVTCTDYMKELTDAILLEGIVFDTWTPMSASAWLIQKAIDTGQFKPTDDNGTPLLSCAGYNLGTNPLVNFPDIFNFDSSLFTLASGTLGSFTTGNFGFASFGVPAASMGQTYTAFELPNQYIIASTVQIYGWTIASYSQTLPPASGTTIFDFVNGNHVLQSARRRKGGFVLCDLLQSTELGVPSWDASRKCHQPDSGYVRLSLERERLWAVLVEIYRHDQSPQEDLQPRAVRPKPNPDEPGSS